MVKVLGKLMVVMAMVVFALVGVTHNAYADDFECRGSIGAVTKDNIVVPNGATCRLTGTRVQGNINVLTNAVLIADGVDVEGNIQSEGATRVRVIGNSVVDGSIQIKQGREALLNTVTVGSDVQIEQNRGAVRITNTNVEGNMQVKQNTGGVYIFRNTIRENLQCEQNTPAPTGGQNAAGDKEGQCARL